MYYVYIYIWFICLLYIILYIIQYLHILIIGTSHPYNFWQILSQSWHLYSSHRDWGTSMRSSAFWSPTFRASWLLENLAVGGNAWFAMFSWRHTSFWQSAIWIGNIQEDSIQEDSSHPKIIEQLHLVFKPDLEQCHLQNINWFKSQQNQCQRDLQKPLTNESHQ